MTITKFPTRVTATKASRNFSTVIERAKHGESFTVMKNGEEVARILPPENRPPNGAAIMAFLRSWQADPVGFSDETVELLDSLADPNERDMERMAWLDD